MHAQSLSVNENTPAFYCLAGTPGPATLHAWRGKMKRPTIPVAWVKIGKSYISYHLMGVSTNAKLRGTLSKELRARMQGTSCFNFTVVEEGLFAELDQLTGGSIAAFRNAGFIVN
jgi:hypothetical protein